MQKVKIKHADLKAWRDHVGLKQTDAAYLLGISRSQYSKLERGTHTTTAKRARMIVEKTGVPFDALMGAA